jgi:hypothetical protein
MIDRREMLGMFGGAGLVGLATAGAARAQDHAHAAGGHAEHLRTIAECARICNETAHHCLDELRAGRGDREKHALAHQMTMDCQAFCVLAGTLMARSSPLEAPAHAACAEACRLCAEACEGGDEVMKACAEACRKCEEACRSMAKGHEGHHHHEPAARPAAR